MSMGWYEQRLNGVYLWHDEGYKRVDFVELNRGRWAEYEDQAGRNPSPEVLAPFVDVSLKGQLVPYTQCEIRWPREGYNMSAGDKRASWFGRNLQRIYVLGPTHHQFDRAPNNPMEFKDWINAPVPEYGTLEQVLKWGGSDVILDRTTVARAVERNTIRIYDSERLLFSIRRRGDIARGIVADDVRLSPELDEFFQPLRHDLPYRGPAYDVDQPVPYRGPAYDVEQAVPPVFNRLYIDDAIGEDWDED